MIAAGLIGVLVLTGCTPQPDVVAGSSVAVAVDNPFTSYNPATSYGDTPANAEIAYATNSGFNYYDNEMNLVADESFGRYEKLSDDPLVVRYTIADGVTWSDGVAVDAADLLLAWVAMSGAYNSPDLDPKDYTDPETGQFTAEFPKDVVFFDSGADPERPSGIGLVSGLPEISDDRKSITLTYDEPYVDWEAAFFGLTSPGLPAHIVAGKALELDDEEEAKDALIAAVTDRQVPELAAISRFWNTGFTVADMPDPGLLVGSGPYVVTDFVAGQYVTLSANERYTGARKPTVETITVRFVADPLAAVQALQNGDIQVISPQATVDTLDALGRLDLTVLSGYQAIFEHISLQVEGSRNGLFGDIRVREAFLKTIPRQQIVEELIAPIQEDAVTRDSYLFVPGAEGYDDVVGSNGSAAYAEVDIAGATALLAEAGVSNPEVCVLYGSTNPRRASEFALIQASAALAGFSVTDCGRPDWRTLLGTAGSYDAALFGWQSTSLGITGNSVAYRTGGINNLNGYSNPEVDALLGDLDGTFSESEQENILAEVDGLLWQDAVGVPLYQFPAVVAYDQDKVTGIAPSVLAPAVFWNVWDWQPVAASASD